MKEVVILGGGFAGVAAALGLRKHLTNSFTITLIDKNSYQLFTPSLYEVATSEEPEKNVAIPLREILGTKVMLIKGEIEEININENKVNLKHGHSINYDYLVVALGSEPSYFGIPGLREHSIPLKWMDEALMIKNKIAALCCKEGKCNKKVKVFIGGGGFSGTEFAAELLTYKDRLAKQHHLAPDCLEISIIQGSERLLKELDPRVSTLAQKRVSSPHVQFTFGEHIKEVTGSKIITDKGNAYSYDILVWTGGVRANSLLKDCGLADPHSRSGQIKVNDFLQADGHPNIFAAGDVVEFVDKAGQIAPTVAQVAEDEGRIVAENVMNLIKQKPLKPYIYSHLGYVVPLRGHFAAAQLKFNIFLSGFVGWVFEQFVVLYYFLRILPLNKAFRKWSIFEEKLM